MTCALAVDPPAQRADGLPEQGHIGVYMRSILSGLAITAILAFATPAVAQQQPRIIGTYTSVADDKAVLEVEGGEKLNVTITPTTGFARLDKATQSDLKPGLFVGVGARPQQDGSQKAVQIVIFPETMRGTGEGHRAWGVMPEATMTNGAIADTVQAVDGPNFTLNYKDGAQKVTTPGDASVLALTLTDKAALKTGARGQVSGQKQPDGSITAARITIWGDGVNPY